MTVTEREKFLAEPHVGVLAVARAGQPPLAVPIWYDYEPGGELLLWTQRGSAKERAIQAAGELSLSVQQEARPYRYVTVSGPVVAASAKPTDAEAFRIAARYSPDDQARAFVDGRLNEGSVLIRVRPEKWLSSDHSKA